METIQVEVILFKSPAQKIFKLTMIKVILQSY